MFLASTRKVFLSLSFLLSQLVAAKVYAQENGVVTGKVIDRESQMPLEGAIVALEGTEPEFGIKRQ